MGKLNLLGAVGMIFAACGLYSSHAGGATAQNMIGRQSQNEGILVLPAPPEVTIDGQLDEWDLTGRIWVFADTSVRNRYSAEVAAMWDQEALYVAVKWRDPTPMHSTVDPDFNPESGWKADSVQLRVRTADQTSWLTTWYFTPKKMPVLHIARWKVMNNARKGQEKTVLRAEPGGTELGQGAHMAYRKDVDGKGYVQEMRLPWRLIYRTPPQMVAGETLRIGMEFLWGDPTGNTWPIHRYADNMAPGHTSRQFYWTAYKAWGEAKLVAAGQVPTREYVSEAGRVEGTVPLRLTLPKSAAAFTVVLENAAGERVRTVGADLDPVDYTVAEEGDRRVVEVKWDCLRDVRKYLGRAQNFRPVYELVKEGAYRVRGLYHEGLGVEYEMCFYNPGIPPWRVQSGDGGWGADHAAPLCVARAGDWVAVSWPGAEGGSGIIGIDETGRKRWGEKRGGKVLAANATHVYAIQGSWHKKEESLIRLGVRDGSYQPFVVDGKELPFELPTAHFFDGAALGHVVDMDATDTELAFATSDGAVVLVDLASATTTATLTVGEGLSRVAHTPQGDLIAIVGDTVQEVGRSPASGVRAVACPGLGLPIDIAVDEAGNLAVADMGPDKQVKVYADGKLLYACGIRGGRPLRGRWVPQGLLKMSSIDFDKDGQLWVVEHWDYPRRVSVWGRDGKLVRDYLGNTGYAGSGAYIHDQDPTLGYVGPLEFELDKKSRSWALQEILWVPDSEAGEGFRVPDRSHVLPQRLRTAVSGQMREYLYCHDPRSNCGQVVFMKRRDGWKPVAAICLVGHLNAGFSHRGVIERMPEGEFADLNPQDGLYWNDTNKDGKVQRAECEVVKTEHPGKLDDSRHRGRPALSLGNGWGGRIGKDLVFYTDGLTRHAPVGFDDEGAPRYAPEGSTPVGVKERGDLVPVCEEDLLLCLSWLGYAGPTRFLGIDAKAGEERWYYPNPYPGVHGSHRSTMPEPGLLIGPLKIMGVADLGGAVGRILMLRGNLGQDFLFTTDGLFVGTLFQDGRLPAMKLPPKEEQLVGMPMGGFSEGGEPFNGWFGRQDDGVVRLTTGMARQACMILQVKGLETVRRFDGPLVTLDAALLAQAAADNRERMAASALKKRGVIKHLTAPPVLDGKLDEWKQVSGLRLERPGSPERASVHLAWDDQALYVAFSVRDESTWKNEGKDHTRLFKTGDAVDVQLALGGDSNPKRRQPVVGDLRLVISQLNGKPAVVLMAPVAPEAAKALRTRYHSPVMDKVFDRVEVLADARLEVAIKPGDRYTGEVAIPWAALGLAPKKGLSLRGDVGLISSDAGGAINVARTYWANEQTNLVNDLPSEAWLYPNSWGELTFE